MSKRKLGGSKGVALKSPPKKSKPKSPRAASTRVAVTIYSVHPGVAKMGQWVGELKTKTGRSLEEWIEHIQDDGPGTETDCRDWLQSDYSLGTNAAWWLAEKAFGDPLALSEDTPQGYLSLAPQYVEQMYAGAKTALRPLHDELVRLTQSLGEVRICPCRTMVPLYRRHVFAQIKPASAKRIDLGFALGEEPFTTRLRDTGGLAKKDRITHSVAITLLSDIDLQVKRWLKQAYDRDVS